jgi:hypothetical protein
MATITSVYLSRTSIWYKDTQGIEFSFIAEGPVGVGIKYRILINGVELQSNNEFSEPPLNISTTIPPDYLNIIDNLVRLEIDSEDSVNTFFEHLIVKEDINTPVFRRQFDFKEDYMDHENIEVISGQGISIINVGEAEFSIEIPTDTRSKLKGIDLVESPGSLSLIPVMSSNVQGGYEVSASSVYSTTYPAWKAFNGLYTTDADSWTSANTAWTPQWLMMKLPYPQLALKYGLLGPATAGHAPKAWRLEGSQDGIVWDILDTRVNIPIPVTGVWVDYGIKNPGSYLYYRLFIVEKNGAVNYVRVGEFRLIGTKLQYTDALGAGSKVRFLISLDGVTYKTLINGQWSIVPKQEILNSGLHNFELLSVTAEQWRALSATLFLGRFILLCGMYNERENDPLLHEISVTFDEVSVETSAGLQITTPEEGFKKSLDVGSQTYTLTLETGMAFDDVSVDYDMYTTPDRIKLRPLSFGTLVGGHQSSVMAVEVVSGYETEDFDVELSVAKDGRAGIQQGNYVLLDDSIIPEYRTKIEMSLIENPFSPMYPVRFRLNAGQKRTVYIRVLPQMVNTGNELFQIKLISRPI